MPAFPPASRVASLPGNIFDQLEQLALTAHGAARSLIDLSKGSPDLPPPDAIIQRLRTASFDPNNHGYPPFLGKKSTKQAIAAFYQRVYGVTLDAETEVTLFHGSHIGIMGIPQAIVNPGETIISTDPCYPAYRCAAQLAQANFHAIAVDERDGFLPDYTRVPAEVAAQARLLLINYPNNPTGALATRPFFERTLAFAQQNRLAVLHDFAYAALGSGPPPLSLLQIPDAKAYAVETYTLSKTFNMAGWRFGFAVGNASIIAAFNQFHIHAYSSVYGAVQDAAETALSLPQPEVAALNRVYLQRRATLMHHLARIGWPASPGMGTFFVWLKVPTGHDSQSLARLLLEQAQVLVAPGIGFGQGGKDYIRVSLTIDETRLIEAIERIGALGLF
jgi:aminotransferase